MLKIKTVLDKRGKNQKWLSEQLGISENATSNLVNGSSKPSLKRLWQISEVLQVPISDLFNDERGFISVFQGSENPTYNERFEIIETDVRILKEDVRNMKSISLKFTDGQTIDIAPPTTK